MRRVWKLVGCAVFFLFSVTLAEAWAPNEKPVTTKRLREEMKTEEQRAREAKANEMTPEQKQKWNERKQRVKAEVDKWLVNPVKKLKPQRHPGSPDKQLAADRQEKMDNFVEKLVPRRYPKGYTTDTKAQPASYTTEGTK